MCFSYKRLEALKLDYKKPNNLIQFLPHRIHPFNVLQHLLMLLSVLVFPIMVGEQVVIAKTVSVKYTYASGCTAAPTVYNVTVNPDATFTLISAPGANISFGTNPTYEPLGGIAQTSYYQRVVINNSGGK